MKMLDSELLKTLTVRALIHQYRNGLLGLESSLRKLLSETTSDVA